MRLPPATGADSGRTGVGSMRVPSRSSDSRSGTRKQPAVNSFHASELDSFVESSNLLASDEGLTLPFELIQSLLTKPNSAALHTVRHYLRIIAAASRYRSVAAHQLESRRAAVTEACEAAKKLAESDAAMIDARDAELSFARISETQNAVTDAYKAYQFYDKVIQQAQAAIPPLFAVPELSAEQRAAEVEALVNARARVASEFYAAEPHRNTPSMRSKNIMDEFLNGLVRSRTERRLSAAGRTTSNESSSSDSDGEEAVIPLSHQKEAELQRARLEERERRRRLHQQQKEAVTQMLSQYVRRIQRWWRGIVVRMRFKLIFAAFCRVRRRLLQRAYRTWLVAERQKRFHRQRLYRRGLSAFMANVTLLQIRREQGARRVEKVREQLSIAAIFLMWRRYTRFQRLPVEMKGDLQCDSRTFPIWDDWYYFQLQCLRFREHALNLNFATKQLSCWRRWQQYVRSRHEKRIVVLMARAHANFHHTRKHFMMWRYTIINKYTIELRDRARMDYYFRRWRAYILRRRIEMRARQRLRRVMLFRYYVDWRNRWMLAKMVQFVGCLRMQQHRRKLLFCIFALLGDVPHTKFLTCWQRWKSYATRRSAFRKWCEHSYFDDAARLLRMCISAWHGYCKSRRQRRLNPREISRVQSAVGISAPRFEATLSAYIQFEKNFLAESFLRRMTLFEPEDLPSRLLPAGTTPRRRTRRHSSIVLPLRRFSRDREPTAFIDSMLLYHVVQLLVHKYVEAQMRRPKKVKEAPFIVPRAPIGRAPTPSSVAIAEIARESPVGGAERSLLGSPLSTTSNERESATPETPTQISDSLIARDEEARRIAQRSKIARLKQAKEILCALESPFTHKGIVDVACIAQYIEEERQRCHVLAVKMVVRDRRLLRKQATRSAALHLSTYNPSFTVEPRGVINFSEFAVEAAGRHREKLQQSVLDDLHNGRAVSAEVLTDLVTTSTPALLFLTRLHWPQLIDLDAERRIFQRKENRKRLLRSLYAYDFHTTSVRSVSAGSDAPAPEPDGFSMELRIKLDQFQFMDLLKYRAPGALVKKLESLGAGAGSLFTEEEEEFQRKFKDFKVLSMMGWNEQLVLKAREVHLSEPPQDSAEASRPDLVLAAKNHILAHHRESIFALQRNPATRRSRGPFSILAKMLQDEANASRPEGSEPPPAIPTSDEDRAALQRMIRAVSERPAAKRTVEFASVAQSLDREVTEPTPPSSSRSRSSRSSMRQPSGPRFSTGPPSTEEQVVLIDKNLYKGIPRRNAGEEVPDPRKPSFVQVHVQVTQPKNLSARSSGSRSTASSLISSGRSALDLGDARRAQSANPWSRLKRAVGLTGLAQRSRSVSSLKSATEPQPPPKKEKRVVGRSKPKNRTMNSLRPPSVSTDPTGSGDTSPKAAGTGNNTPSATHAIVPRLDMLKLEESRQGSDRRPVQTDANAASVDQSKPLGNSEDPPSQADDVESDDSSSTIPASDLTEEEEEEEGEEIAEDFEDTTTVGDESTLPDSEGEPHAKGRRKTGKRKAHVVGVETNLGKTQAKKGRKKRPKDEAGRHEPLRARNTPSPPGRRPGSAAVGPTRPLSPASPPAPVSLPDVNRRGRSRAVSTPMLHSASHHQQTQRERERISGTALADALRQRRNSTPFRLKSLKQGHSNPDSPAAPSPSVVRSQSVLPRRSGSPFAALGVSNSVPFLLDPPLKPKRAEKGKGEHVISSPASGHLQRQRPPSASKENASPRRPSRVEYIRAGTIRLSIVATGELPVTTTQADPVVQPEERCSPGTDAGPVQSPEETQEPKNLEVVEPRTPPPPSPLIPHFEDDPFPEPEGPLKSAPSAVLRPREEPVSDVLHRDASMLSRKSTLSSRVSLAGKLGAENNRFSFLHSGSVSTKPFALPGGDTPSEAGTEDEVLVQNFGSTHSLPAIGKEHSLKDLVFGHSRAQSVAGARETHARGSLVGKPEEADDTPIPLSPPALASHRSHSEAEPAIMKYDNFPLRERTYMKLMDTLVAEAERALQETQRPVNPTPVAPTPGVFMRSATSPATHSLLHLSSRFGQSLFRQNVLKLGELQAAVYHLVFETLSEEELQTAEAVLGQLTAGTKPPRAPTKRSRPESGQVKPEGRPVSAAEKTPKKDQSKLPNVKQPISVPVVLREAESPNARVSSPGSKTSVPLAESLVSSPSMLQLVANEALDPLLQPQERSANHGPITAAVIAELLGLTSPVSLPDQYQAILLNSQDRPGSPPPPVFPSLTQSNTLSILQHLEPPIQQETTAPAAPATQRDSPPRSARSTAPPSPQRGSTPIRGKDGMFRTGVTYLPPAAERNVYKTVPPEEAQTPTKLSWNEDIRKRLLGEDDGERQDASEEVAARRTLLQRQLAKLRQIPVDRSNRKEIEALQERVQRELQETKSLGAPPAASEVAAQRKAQLALQLAQGKRVMSASRHTPGSLATTLRTGSAPIVRAGQSPIS